MDYLKSEANRLEKIIEYENKMNKASNDSDKAYYAAVIKELLVSGETLENYKQVLKEYQIAYEVRKENMIKLGEELKQMKRLKV